MNDYVLGFRFDEDFNHVLLVKKKRPEWQRGYYNGIGGKIEDKDTSPTYAMVREFKEECGIETDPHDWKFRGRMVGSFGKVYVYRSVGDISQYATMTDEQIDKIPVDDVVDINLNGVIHNVKTLICALLDSEHFIFEFNYN